MKKSFICILTALCLLFASCSTYKISIDFAGIGNNSGIGFPPISLFPAVTSGPEDSTDPPEVSTLVEDDATFIFSPAEDGTGYILDDVLGSNITYLEIPSYYKGAPVVAISNNALQKLRNLEDIILPDTLTEISRDAFFSCAKLNYSVYKNIKYLGTENNPYEYLIGAAEGANVNTYPIHNSTRVIGAEAFSSVRNTTGTTLKIPDSVEYIGASAFEKSGPHIQITFPSSLIEIGDRAFNETDWVYRGSITLPENLRKIGSSAFEACDTLYSVSFPDSLESIGDSAFRGCRLTQISFGQNPTDIGDSAFEGCNGLSVLNLGKVRSIGHKAFAGCNSIQSFNIGDSLEEFYSDSFADTNMINRFDECSYVGSGNYPRKYLLKAEQPSNKKLGINASVKKAATDAFKSIEDLDTIEIVEGVSESFTVKYGCLIDNSTKTLILGTNSAHISDSESVTSIASYAFYNRKNLVSFSFPSSVTHIGESAFEGCESLKVISVPISVRKIGDRSFFGCTSLVNATVRSEIGREAFRNCTSLSNVVLTDYVVRIGEYAFANTGLETFSVPISIFSLPDGLFAGCQQLNTVFIHDWFTSMGSFVFKNCPKFTTVRYNGTAKKWNSLTLSSQWDAGTNEKTVFCYDENIIIPPHKIEE